MPIVAPAAVVPLPTKTEKPAQIAQYALDVLLRCVHTPDVLLRGFFVIEDRDRRQLRGEGLRRKTGSEKCGGKD